MAYFHKTHKKKPNFPLKSIRKQAAKRFLPQTQLKRGHKNFMEALYSTCCSSNDDQTNLGNQNITDHSMVAFLNVTELHETLLESYN